MYCDQAVVDQSERIQARDLAHAVQADRVGNFLCSFVQVTVHRHVELVGEQADPLETGVAHRVRRVRRKTGANQIVATIQIVHFAGAIEVFVLRLCPRSRKIDDRQADQRTETMTAISCSCHVREKIILAAAGGATAQHFGDRQLDTVGDEFGPDHRSLDWPDVFGQPAHQRQIVGDAAQ